MVLNAPLIVFMLLTFIVLVEMSELATLKIDLTSLYFEVILKISGCCQSVSRITYENKFRYFLYMNNQQNFNTFSIMIVYLFGSSLGIKKVTFSENLAYVLNG